MNDKSQNMNSERPSLRKCTNISNQDFIQRTLHLVDHYHCCVTLTGNRYNIVENHNKAVGGYSSLVLICVLSVVKDKCLG